MDNKNSNKNISVVILVKNEQSRIRSCLSSVSWADEVIVVDNGSTDKTRDIAKKFGVYVVASDSTDFSKLRMIGASSSHGRWILYVDADETVTEVLRAEIFDIVHRSESGEPVAYRVQRKNYYLGHLWPQMDTMQRLFFRDRLRGWRGPLHETAIVDGEEGQLRHPLIHNTHRTLEEMLAKTNVWSEQEARLRLTTQHPPVVWWRLIRVMCTGFIRSYFHEGGWRTGTVGCIESIYQAFSMFVTYAKLWELQQKNENR